MANDLDWINFEEVKNTFPEKRVYVGLSLKELSTQFTTPNWKSKIVMEIKIYDRRNPTKLIEKVIRHQGEAQTFQIPWKNSQEDAIQHAWDEIAREVLLSLEKYLFEGK